MTLSYSSHTQFSILSFKISPPPPQSTLFPYTTLFRSCGRSRERLHHASQSARVMPYSMSSEHSSPTQNDWRVCPSDRKSTRLNSSHRCISYAVFCLKKKKKNKKIKNKKNTRYIYKI